MYVYIPPVYAIRIPAAALGPVTGVCTLVWTLGMRIEGSWKKQATKGLSFGFKG